MLETVLIASASALFVSLGAHTVLLWDLRRTLRQLGLDMAELQDDLLSEKRKRAAVASVQARTSKLSELDESIVAGRSRPQQVVEPDDPWWSGLTGPKS